ncbi:MAG: hypothetical protein LAO51_08945 [Acidobacteriia bacterium]|nr:hypothetical protein [Terriglobia bacterium]
MRSSDLRALQPSPWLRTAAITIAVLAVCGFVVDVALQGPLTCWVWEEYVVARAEAAWGFHAQWIEYSNGHQYLTILAVTPGGPFDRAGVRPGYIDSPMRSASYGEAGGLYCNLDRSTDEAHLVLWERAFDRSSQRKIVARRKPAS